ncbi:SAM-dependent methyltransferase [Saccharothrix syringae]|uniref:SAM-dependent methyltransferase n=1 Tax=Saccharothrix syringae TaxID=103733 RepID=A0A5Q0GXE3_SACSY|nr:SAM-dependent methyltransferase [Saccharothrix syringae]QFZ18553.1 SAM-dependent methyltransferase [Saccharothrix syringae]
MTLFDIAPEIADQDEIVVRSVPVVTALETDFPAVEFSKLGEHESWRKEVFRPATSTHKWWAKRLGSVFRGILASAVTETSEEALNLYGSAARLKLSVFDPFSGSGTTIVEAVKMGASAVGSDINPVATLVQRQAVLRWDSGKLEQLYKTVEEACREEVDRVHRAESGETVLYYFWVATAPCVNPACGRSIRLFSSHVFSQNAYPKRVPAAQIVCPVCLDVIPGRYDFKSVECRNGHTVERAGAVSRSTATCPHCQSVTKPLAALQGQRPGYEMYAKMVLDKDGGKRYEPVTDWDRALYSECTGLLDAQRDTLVVPAGGLETGVNTRQAMSWGFTNWVDFFNDRQLYSLGLLASAIRDVAEDGFEREALVALFSGVLEFNNMFCSFKGEGTGAVRHMFSHHILKPERTPLEAHPWGTPASSGSFSTLYKSRLQRAHAYKTSPTDQVLLGEKIQRLGGLSRPFAVTSTDQLPTGDQSPTVFLMTGDASETKLRDGSIDLVITDPPYMDNVHYSELADFFHSWLRKIQPYAGYPVDQSSTRSKNEVQSPSPEGFGAAITRVWRECFRVLRPTGLMAFTFHQARMSGWKALVESLADAGFVVTAVQPIQGEMSTSVTKYGAEASNLDSVVVCRKSSQVSRKRDAESEAATGYERIVLLRKAGIKVGAGDVRSVIRGRVLSVYTHDPSAFDLEELARQADALAQVYVDRHLAEIKKK